MMMMAMLIPLAEIPVGCPFHLITAGVPDRFRKCGAFGMDSHRFDFNDRDLIVVTNSLRVRVHRFLLTRHVKSYGPSCPFLAWHMFFFPNMETSLSERHVSAGWLRWRIFHYVLEFCRQRSVHFCNFTWFPDVKYSTNSNFISHDW